MCKQKILIAVVLVFAPYVVSAQDYLPEDNGLATYHTGPRYRASESHPLRIVAYVVHPIGWIAREVFFRPFSYMASSTEFTRSFFGYREPFDYRQPECFSADDSVPDCRSVAPFNYDAILVEGEPELEDMDIAAEPVRQVYFPNVNFNFDIRKLNDLGKGRSYQIAELLNESPGVQVVLEGHADYIGSEGYNETLGMDRAEAVKGELVALGVSSERLSTVTFGKSQPVLEQQENWARAVNRRVEIHAGDGGSMASDDMGEEMDDEGA